MRRATLFFGVVLLLITAHRLPAPISEVPESPTPASTVAPTAKPKSKPLPKPKPKSEASESATNPGRQQPSSKRSRFAGTWVGTIQTFPPGNTATVLTVDSTETTMALTWDLSGPPAAKAKLIGDTLQATFGEGLAAPTFLLTPQPDGATARVRMQAFMNDFTAVFHRAAESSGAR
jgi:hypothetical protein